MSADLPAFTFAQLRERTPGLSDADRMETFYSLPVPLQLQAWAHLAEWAGHRSELDFRDYCGDDR